MRTLRSGALAALLLALPATAVAAPQPTMFPNGRYSAAAEGASLSFVLQRLQITGLQVRMPLSCQNTRTHVHSAPTLVFGTAGKTAPASTYSRIFLPADGAIRQGIDRPLPAQDELVEAIQVAGPGPCHQFFVGRRHRDGAHFSQIKTLAWAFWL